MTGFEINVYELVLVLLASGFLYAVMIAHDRHWLGDALLMVCILPALFLAAEGVSELLTNDETYMIDNLTNLKDVTSRQWNYLNYRTSVAFIGNLVTLMGAWSGIDGLHAKMLAKSVHWCLGFAILTGIFWTLCRTWIAPRLLPEFFLFYFYSALLLPTNVLSLKVANYDMLAMLLGIWGILCSVIGCERIEQRQTKSKESTSQLSILSTILGPDNGLTLLGVVLTTLAAQEKQIAGPFLNLAIILSVLMRIRKEGRIDWWMPIQVGICVLVTVLVVAITHGIVAIWRPRGLPHFDLIGAWAGLFFHIDVALRDLAGSQPSALHVAALAFTTFVLVPPVVWRMRAGLGRITKIVGIAFPLLFILALLAGAFSYYTVEGYRHPAVSIPVGYYVPTPEINGEVVHFLAKTSTEHFIRKIGSAYTAFAISFPIAFLLLAIWALAAAIQRAHRTPTVSFAAFQALGMLGLAMPLFHVLTNTPVGIRYFDVWIFIDVLVLAVIGCQLFEAFSRNHLRISIVAAFCLLLLVETVPFRPLFAAFRPWWAGSSEIQIAPGKLMHIWPGWGEETMIAGRHLRSMARMGQLPSPSFRLFAIYRSDWLQSDPKMTTYWASSAPYLSFTENDYYLINRAAKTINDFGMITNREPIWKLEYRGVPQAWLYRGSDLATGN